MPEHRQRESSRLIEQVVRRERGRLVASLVRHMGPHQIDLAEDLVQEAIVAAIEHWPYRGIPDNPAAWLTKTAKNKLIDGIRRRKLEADYISDLENQASGDNKHVDENEVALLTPDDPELSLLFLCCHDELNPQEQISLALKLVGGFTAQDIASLFFEKESATGQRLARAKRKLRQEMASSPISAEHMRAQIPTVLKALYLLFTYAYAPKKGARLIMRDTAYEALRIAETLQNYPMTKSTEGAVLAALMCFQAARFDARSDEAGEIVLL
jgi:RNA polymerase sigma-70 factor (ECF subfamily)